MELKAGAKGKGKRLHRVETGTREVKASLDRFYQALKTGKLELQGVAPRIKQLRGQLGELDTSECSQYSATLPLHHKRGWIE